MEGTQSFNVADVARIHNIRILKASRNNVFCVCPFCGDSRKKFSYNISKNYYHCWNCGRGGKALQLHMELSDKDYGDDFKEAAKDIFEAINGDKVLANIHRESIDMLKHEEETPKADDRTIDATYRAMLSMLTLKREHKENLLERGFTEKQIEFFQFKSTPTDPEGLCRKLRREGYTMEGVPGFYFNKESNEWTLKISAKGYFCPVYDSEYRLLLGFQIRLDKPIGKTKYLWLSSAEENKGCSSGALTTCLVGKNQNIILVIEGILKSTLVYTFLRGEVTVIGVPGTKCLTTIRPYLDRYTTGYVYEAYDMDKAVKTDDPKKREKSDNIAKDAKALRDLIDQETSLDYRENGLFWDFHDETVDGKNIRYWDENYKGLDDFLKDYEKKDLFTNWLIDTAKKSISLQDYLKK